MCIKVKEKIIIDGVDVAGCRLYLYRDKQSKGSRSCGEGLVDCNGKECLYKQLQRKIQECEKLRESNQAWGLTVTHLRAELEEEREKTMWITQNNKIWYSESEYKELEERINQQHINIMRNNLQYHDIDTTNKKYKQALEEIRDIAKTGLKPVCYKANCSTCRCYTKDDKNYSLHCLINSYINEDGELMDGNCDFAEALESLIDSERVACNKAKPIADKILNKINEVLK